MGIVGQATNNNLGSRFMYEMKNGRLKERGGGARPGCGTVAGRVYRSALVLHQTLPVHKFVGEEHQQRLVGQATNNNLSNDMRSVPETGDTAS
jgi:hypothetical protein